MRSVGQLYHQYVGRKAMLTVLAYADNTDEEGHVRRGREVVDGAVDKGSVGIRIPVTISDVRQCFGQENVLVTPHHGEGSTWVRVNERLVIVEEWPFETEQAEHDDDTIAAHGEDGPDPSDPQ